jgi:hypothetical protein
MIEIIKVIGSYIGLLAGLFVFYDRFAKGRPVVSITNSARSDASVTAD